VLTIAPPPTPLLVHSQEASLPSASRCQTTDPVPPSWFLTTSTVCSEQGLRAQSSLPAGVHRASSDLAKDRRAGRSLGSRLRSATPSKNSLVSRVRTSRTSVYRRRHLPDRTLRSLAARPVASAGASLRRFRWSSLQGLVCDLAVLSSMSRNADCSPASDSPRLPEELRSAIGSATRLGSRGALVGNLGGCVAQHRVGARSAALLLAHHRSLRSCGPPSARPLAWLPWCFSQQPGQPGGHRVSAQVCSSASGSPPLPEEQRSAIGSATRLGSRGTSVAAWAVSLGTGWVPGSATLPLAHHRPRRSSDPPSAWPLAWAPVVLRSATWADASLGTAGCLGSRLSLGLAPTPGGAVVRRRSATRFGSLGPRSAAPSLGATTPGGAVDLHRLGHSPGLPRHLGRQPGRLCRSAPGWSAARSLARHRSRKSCGLPSTPPLALAPLAPRSATWAVVSIGTGPGASACRPASDTPPLPEELWSPSTRPGLRRCLRLTTAPGRAAVRHRLGRSPRLPWALWSAALPLARHRPRKGFGSPSTRPLATAPVVPGRQPGGCVVRHRAGASAAGRSLARHRPRRSCGPPSTRPLASAPGGALLCGSASDSPPPPEGLRFAIDSAARSAPVVLQSATWAAVSFRTVMDALVCGSASGSPPPPEGLRSPSARPHASAPVGALVHGSTSDAPPLPQDGRSVIGSAARLGSLTPGRRAAASVCTGWVLWSAALPLARHRPRRGAVRHRLGRSPRLQWVLRSAALPRARHRSRRSCGSPSARPLASAPVVLRSATWAAASLRTGWVLWSAAVSGSPPLPEELWLSIDCRSPRLPGVLRPRGSASGSPHAPEGTVVHHRLGHRPRPPWVLRSVALPLAHRSPGSPRSARGSAARLRSRGAWSTTPCRSAPVAAPVRGPASGSPLPPEELQSAIGSTTRLGSRGCFGLRLCLRLATAPGGAAVCHWLGRSPRLPWCFSRQPGRRCLVRHRPGALVCGSSLARHRSRRSCGLPSTQPLASAPGGASARGSASGSPLRPEELRSAFGSAARLGSLGAWSTITWAAVSRHGELWSAASASGSPTPRWGAVRHRPRPLAWAPVGASVCGSASGSPPLPKELRSAIGSATRLGSRGAWSTSPGRLCSPAGCFGLRRAPHRSRRSCGWLGRSPRHPGRSVDSLVGHVAWHNGFATVTWDERAARWIPAPRAAVHSRRSCSPLARPVPIARAWFGRSIEVTTPLAAQGCRDPVDRATLQSRRISTSPASRSCLPDGARPHKRKSKHRCAAGRSRDARVLEPRCAPGGGSLRRNAAHRTL
jgi:hypothetical protein